MQKSDIIVNATPEGDFSTLLNYIDGVAPDRLIDLRNPG